MKYFSSELTIAEVEEMDYDSELWESFCYDVDEKIIQDTESEIRYIVEKNCIQIPILGIDVHYAVVQILNENNEWEVNYDTFIFMKADTYEIVYYEKSSLTVSIHNYLYITGLKSKIPSVGNISCYLMKK